MVKEIRSTEQLEIGKCQLRDNSAESYITVCLISGGTECPALYTICSKTFTANRLGM